MKEFLNENLTKIFGTIVAVLGTLQTLVSTNAFDGLISESGIRWMNIIIALLTTLFGGATVARGFNNTTKERVAEAMTEALNTPAPSTKQTGFARAGLLALLIAVAAPMVVSLSGCQALGLATPQSYDQRVAYVRGELTGLVNATASAVEKGTLAREDGVRVLGLAKDARAVLDAADAAMGAGDLSTAEGRLQLAIGILTQVQTFVERESP